MNLNFFKSWLHRRESHRLDKDAVGKLGEKYAVNYLRKQHYAILETNFRNKLGEIDIIAGSSNILVFVEVKTRNEKMPLNSPGEAVTLSKQKKIRQIAETFTGSFKGSKWNQCRFDVIEIIIDSKGTIKSINHLENAF